MVTSFVGVIVLQNQKKKKNTGVAATKFLPKKKVCKMIELRGPNMD